MSDDKDQRSWWSRTFGRSILSALIGHFFADKNNAVSVIAILLVLTLCYVVAIREKYEYVNGLLNIVFVVIGYYFGSKRQKDTDEDEKENADNVPFSPITLREVQNEVRLYPKESKGPPEGQGFA
jgi:glucose uptake protein GlcU